jgi:hypothetical protein
MPIRQQRNDHERHRMSKRDRKALGNEDGNQDAPFSAESTGDLGERIRERAYQLYLERGGSPGNELEDWLRAENEERQLADAPRPTRQNSPRLNGKTAKFTQGSTESDNTPPHRLNNFS